MMEWKTIANALYSPLPAPLEQKVYDAAFAENYRHSRAKPEVFVERLALLSEGVFDSDEWELVGVEYLEEAVSCVCGHTGMKKLHHVRNLRTGHAAGIGSSCLEKHFTLESGDVKVFEYLSGLYPGKPYHWLGSKYDIHILAALGFKRAMDYYAKREARQRGPKEYDTLIRKHLNQAFGSFDAPKWQRRLNRGKRLLAYLSRPKPEDRLRIHQGLPTRKPYSVQRAQSVKPVLSVPPAPGQRCFLFEGFENGEMLTMKHSIRVVNGYWYCSCGGYYALWGSKGGRPWMKCEGCGDEYLILEERELPF